MIYVDENGKAVVLKRTYAMSGDACTINIEIKPNNKDIQCVLPVVKQLGFNVDCNDNCISVSDDAYGYWQTEFEYATDSVESFCHSFIGRWLGDVCRLIKDGTLDMCYYHDFGCTAEAEYYILEYANGIITAKYCDFDINNFVEEPQGDDNSFSRALREYLTRTEADLNDVADDPADFFSSSEYKKYCGGGVLFIVDIDDILSLTNDLSIIQCADFSKIIDAYKLNCAETVALFVTYIGIQRLRQKNHIAMPVTQDAFAVCVDFGDNRDAATKALYQFYNRIERLLVNI